MKTKYIKEINETIAEAFGWKSEPPTDYWNDLNSCREMENSISPEQKADYITTLEALCFKGDQSLETYWSVFHSTAPQRCEAFLRSLSLWKEEWSMKTTLEKCPQCKGDRVDIFLHKAGHYSIKYSCGSQVDNWASEVIRTELCHEREARHKVEVELEKVTDQKAKIIDILDEAIADIHSYECSGSAHKYQSRLNALERKL